MTHTAAPSERRGAASGREIAEAHIESFSHDGRGVAHIDGKATFIEGALPGETVRFRYLNRRNHYDSGRLVEVVMPSPDRVTPRCPHFGICGGCSLQHMSPEAQLAAKQQVLAEQLERLGKVKPESWLAPLSGPAWGYRRRARLGVRRVPKKGGVLVGFREKRKSFIADLESCAVLVPHVSALIPALRKLITNLSCPDRIPQVEVAVGDNFAGSEIGRASARPEGGCAMDGAPHEATALVFRHLVPLVENDCAQLRAFGEQYGMQVYLQPHGPESLEALWPENPAPLYYRLPEFDVAIQFRPTDFIQVNAALNAAMVHQALALLELKPEDRVLDLFSGLGNFTLPLARRAGRVLGIEVDAELIDGARANAARNGLNNVEFRAGNLYDEAGPSPWAGCTFNKLLLDPPRSGAMEAIKRLAKPLPERIVYVSCYPATLARDAEYLVRVLGYRLAATGAMDMFPHTSHMESMALFVRP
jgi:23S rRNA (uracil1939-C5)-methyltransferase